MKWYAVRSRENGSIKIYNDDITLWIDSELFEKVEIDPIRMSYLKPLLDNLFKK